MCNSDSRRSFLYKSATLLGASSLANFASNLAFIPTSIMPNTTFKNFVEIPTTFQQLLKASSNDKADNPQYLLGTDMSEWHKEVHPILKEVIPTLLDQRTIGLPALELGSYLGESALVLKSIFPNKKIISVDLYPYYKSENLFIGDIRKHPLPQNKYSLIWNDISNWRNSPRSKMAAFSYSMKNLAVGGLYIDDKYSSLPIDIDWSGLDLIYKKGYVSIFRKIS